MVARSTMIIGLMMAGCGGLEISRDYDPNEDFARLRTWAWSMPRSAQDQGVPRVSTLTQERIRQAIENELNRKHYRKLDEPQADFKVRYFAAVEQRLDSDSEGWYSGTLRLRDEGTLVIDFISSKENRLIWRGVAKTEIQFKMTPQEREAGIQQAVHQILEKFPPTR